VVTLGCLDSRLVDVDAAYRSWLGDHIAVEVLATTRLRRVRHGKLALGHHAAVAQSPQRGHCPVKSIFVQVRLTNGS